METKFTPGPWKWWTSNSWRRLKRDDRGISQSVLEPFVARDGHPDCSISEADMALIAAAPDLFEALSTVIARVEKWEAAVRQIIGRTPMTGMNLSDAKAALAKARGE